MPHAGTHIPEAVRTDILLDDDDLARELLVMTDHHTDRLFAWVVAHGATALVNQWSRLVVDPERFEDAAAEGMERVGQGAVYTRTFDRRPMRTPDPAARERLLDEVYRPWHRRLSSLVEEHLRAFDHCLVLDCHSFGTVPLPSEADQDPDRPDVCIGTDPFHTPDRLVDALDTALQARGFRVRRDSPFSGSLVPLNRYRRDPRVRAVMLEVRRGTYCDETTGQLLPAWREVARRIELACVDAGVIPAPSGGRR